MLRLVCYTHGDEGSAIIENVAGFGAPRNNLDDRDRLVSDGAGIRTHRGHRFDA